MADYIDRTKIKYTTITTEDRCHNDYYTTQYNVAMKEDIEKIPAADVRENVRGEWHERKDIYPHKPDGEITSWSYKCSRCNRLSQLKYDFCFNCGADMRGNYFENVKED